MAARHEFERQVRDALAHLHDVVYLQTHALTRLAATEPGSAGHYQAGQALRQRLLSAIDTLRPSASGGPPEARRGHLVLVLRYVEGLDPASAGARLGLGKSQFYREQERALTAITSVLAEARATNAPEAAIPTGAVKPKPRVDPGRLPRPATSFIGRDHELTTVSEMLAGAQRGEGSRLLTLSGPPGVGKTRLAVEVAAMAAVRGVFEQVHYVDLSALETGAAGQVLPAIQLALGVPDAVSADALSLLHQHFADRSVLLVLDNFEQLVEAATDLVQLLERSPRTQALVTSRRPLGLYGEREVALAPLATPPADAVSIEQVGEFPAVRLFLERARAADPDFRFAPANVSAVAEICRRLDGLPLAIELAAARLKVLPPRALLERLTNRLDLLTRGARDAPSRQQTLRAAIDWSYRLLEPDEQLALRELAVFAGSFSLAAAEVVVSRGRRPTLDIVQSLLEQGLLLLDSPEPRYRLLETIREYAAERLAESGQGQAVRERHMEYYILASDRPSGRETRLGVEDEANLRDALEAVLHETLTVGRQQGDTRQVALALAGLGTIALARGDLSTAQAHTAESGRLFRELGDAQGAALASLRSGQIAAQAGKRKQAELELQAAVVRLTTLSASGPAAEGLIELAWLALDAGEPVTARTSIEQALELALLSGTMGAAIGVAEAAAVLAYSMARDRVAVRLVAIATAARSQTGLSLGPRQKSELERHLGPERLRMLSAEPNSGGSLSVGVLVREALNAIQE